ncbi:MAG: hypothetical protein J6T38_04185 [Bacteroidaceae bacterium]|nr:hypothetical protein [Bacteroidaceae bacterium]
MKKLVLTIIALVAVATTSFAQYPKFVSYTPLNLRSISYSAPVTLPSTSISLPSTPISIPSSSLSIPSTVNLNTTSVSGYTKSNGTYVQSHVRTMPNNTNWDNYSTKGNVNPYTGTSGSRARDYSSGANNYGVGHIIHTGPRGGQYYNNSNGNKTYVPKRNLW